MPTHDYTPTAAAFANINPGTEVKADAKNPERGPMLVMSGELDHQAPRAIQKATYKKQRSLTIDDGWQQVAQTSLDFIGRFVK